MMYMEYHSQLNRMIILTSLKYIVHDLICCSHTTEGGGETWPVRENA